MKIYLTYYEVAEAAAEDGMTVEEFFFSEDPDCFSKTDWTKTKRTKMNRKNHRNYA